MPLPPAVEAAFATPSGNYNLVLEAVRKLVLRAAPTVEPGPDDALIAMSHVGICGSDSHMRIGFIPFDPEGTGKGLAMGHEGSGYVVKVGARVTNIKVGDLVACEPGVYVPGLGTAKGMISRFFTHPARLCHKMTVSPAEAAYVEPLAVGTHCAVRGGVTKGSKIVILGAGPIGINTCLAAKALGAEWIAIADINEERLQMAKKHAPVDRIINTDKLSSNKAAQKIIESIGFEPEIVLDAAGFPASIDTALRLCAQHGTISLVGVPGKLNGFNCVLIVTREINFVGSFAFGKNGEDFALAASLVNSGKINVKPLITDLVNIGDYEEAFEKSEKGGSTIKVMFKLPQEADFKTSAAAL